MEHQINKKCRLILILYQSLLFVVLSLSHRNSIIYSLKIKFNRPFINNTIQWSSLCSLIPFYYWTQSSNLKDVWSRSSSEYYTLMITINLIQCFIFLLINVLITLLLCLGSKGFSSYFILLHKCVFDINRLILFLYLWSNYFIK